MLKKRIIRVAIINLVVVVSEFIIIFSVYSLIFTYSAVIFAVLGDYLKDSRSIWALGVAIIFGFLIIRHFLPAPILDTFNTWAGYKKTVSKEKYLKFFSKYQYEKIEPDFKPLVKNFLPVFIGLVLLCIFSSLAVNFITGRIIFRKTEVMKRNGYPTGFSDFYRNIPEEQNAAKPIDNVSMLASIKLKTFFEDNLNYERKLDALLIDEKWDAAKKKQAEIILSTCSYIFNEAESILEKYKYYQYADYKKMEMYPFETKHARLVFPLQQIFLLRAKFHLKKGNNNLFWKDIKNNLKLYSLVQQEKDLFAKMASLGIISKTVEFIEDSMSKKSDLTCPKNIMDELLEIRKENSAFEGLKFAMVCEIEEIKYFAACGGMKKARFVKIFFVPTGIQNLNLVACMNYETKLLSLHSLSPQTIKKEGQILDDKLKKLPFYPFILWSIIPTRMDSFYLMEAGIDTKMQILAVATAIRKYKMQNKKYPQKLSELVPKFLTSDLVIDQFSEKELVYKLTKNGFLLYSVGRNFEDDNRSFTFKYYKPNNDIGVEMN
ncbi:MAG: hypothetical protein COS68_05820 [Elusimicrobia bacterium CG06_land_8_20_14_3_00_38_11]|nr:MAG: hypothetical protein COS68_05820 [Elusimicrobia bacterium CG06_land_8_20_14_3_00_38_11]